jgi:2-isopropylmalate synthase
MGSKVNSRGSVLIESGDHRWEASAKGNGPVDALFRAVDLALQDVLGGHPRLLGYDVHAVAEGPDAEGRVTVRVAPPADAPGARSSGTYEGVAQGANIVVASIEAYIDAIEGFLAEDQWSGAIDAAGNNRAAPPPIDDRPQFDEGVSPDHGRWWT